MLVSQAALDPRVQDMKELEREAKDLQRRASKCEGDEAKRLNDLSLDKWSKVHAITKLLKNDPNFPLKLVHYVR